MVRLHRPILDPLGLTFPQYLVLLELFANAPRTVGDLGSRVGMDAGTITPLLKRLETSGKVTRMRDKQDERRVLIDLTAAGERLRTAVLNVTSEVESACELSARELAQLRDTLDRLAHPRG
jgi:DNA-binding MarR family transcriptional regulator